MTEGQQLQHLLSQPMLAPPQLQQLQHQQAMLLQMHELERQAVVAEAAVAAVAQVGAYGCCATCWARVRAQQLDRNRHCLQHLFTARPQLNTWLTTPATCRCWPRSRRWPRRRASSWRRRRSAPSAWWQPALSCLPPSQTLRPEPSTAPSTFSLVAA